jgi:hypothetical protein
MIKLKRKNFLQDLIWYVAKPLRARENHTIEGFITCSPPEITGMTKRETKLTGHLS